MNRWEGAEHVYNAIALYGGHQTSGFRSAAQNAAAGGHPRSKHLSGEAWDATFKDDATAHLAAVYLRARGLTVKEYSGKARIHAQSAPPDPAGAGEDAEP
jgi:uncharacterized protein YcbK (DUF882 family)